ncbi:MAG: hypothetical protein M3N10_06540 [Actinomycetota bacterium]|nr:hypothetical protein [Actinomycetota bacterium]HZY65008.1 hypothetical protein [Rubrobacteraceae bacterium]
MGLAVISLIIIVVIALIAIPVLIRVFGEAVDQNPNRPGGSGEGEEENEEDQGERSGPRR